MHWQEVHVVLGEEESKEAHLIFIWVNKIINNYFWLKTMLPLFKIQKY